MQVWKAKRINRRGKLRRRDQGVRKGEEDIRAKSWNKKERSKERYID